MLPKGAVPQIENVTQITIRTLEGGHPNVVKHERKTGGNQVISPVTKRRRRKKSGQLRVVLAGAAKHPGSRLMD
jgi:ribosomal protein S7